MKPNFRAQQGSWRSLVPITNLSSLSKVAYIILGQLWWKFFLLSKPKLGSLKISSLAKALTIVIPQNRSAPSAQHIFQQLMPASVFLPYSLFSPAPLCVEMLTGWALEDDSFNKNLQSMKQVPGTRVGADDPMISKHKLLLRGILIVPLQCLP